jgi:hypothetical protein
MMFLVLLMLEGNMALDRRLKYEAPIQEARAGSVAGLLMRASIGCIGISVVIALLGHY